VAIALTGKNKEMKTLFSNRYADAFAKTILFCGLIHLCVFIWLALQGNPYILNIFTVVSLNLLFPALGQGMPNFILSFCLTMTMYGLIYKYLTNKGESQDK
jgi:hypothetical protein